MFLEDENNKLWLATSDGLYSYDKQTQTVKEYNEFCNYGDGKMLYQIGIVDEDKIMKDYN